LDGLVPKASCPLGKKRGKGRYECFREGRIKTFAVVNGETTRQEGDPTRKEKTKIEGGLKCFGGVQEKKRISRIVL